jgi:parvulin-like peptidyl-prolyl isomerase
VQTSEIMIANVLVAQEAARQQISVSDADIQAENDRSLAAFLPDDLSSDARQRVLDELLRRRGITYDMWKQIMGRNALLRKMAHSRVVLTDVMVQTEFARLYGPKVQVRHIQLPGIQEAQRVVNLLREGGDFADLARQNSINAVSAAQGGLLPPFSKQDELVAQPIRDAAFALNQPGELSGIVQVGSDCHVLRLEKKLPAEKMDFDQVKDKVRLGLRDRLTEQLQARILAELRRKADVEYANPALRKAAQKPLP